VAASKVIEKPEFWLNGIDDWENIFSRRLKTFLRAIRDYENKEIRNGYLKENHCFSNYMQQSWDSGKLWPYMQLPIALHLT
jgi:hypothetical protein